MLEFKLLHASKSGPLGSRFVFIVAYFIVLAVVVYLRPFY